MRTRVNANGQTGNGAHMGAVIIIAALLLITGCATTSQTYSGARLPAEQVAVVKVPKSVDSPGALFSHILSLKEIDGRKNESGWLPGTYELLPGKHSMTFSLPATGWTGHDIVISFTVEGGKTYFVLSRILGVPTKIWMIEIFNESTGTAIAKKTEKAWYGKTRGYGLFSISCPSTKTSTNQ